MPELRIFKEIDKERYFGGLFEEVKIIDKETKKELRREKRPIRYGFEANSIEGVKEKALEHWNYCQDKNAELYGAKQSALIKAVETRMKNKLNKEEIEPCNP